MKSACVLFRHRGECAVDILGTVGRRELQPYSQTASRILNILHDVRHRVLAVRVRMQESGNTSEPGHNISEQLQALGDELGAEATRLSRL